MYVTIWLYVLISELHTELGQLLIAVYQKHCATFFTSVSPHADVTHFFLLDFFFFF